MQETATVEPPAVIERAYRIEKAGTGCRPARFDCIFSEGAPFDRLRSAACRAPFFLSYRLRSSRLIPRFMRASGSCISSRSHAGKWTAICARGLTPPDEKRLLSTRCRAESHRKAELHPFGPAPSRQRMSGKDIERMGHVCYDRAVARLHGQIR